MKKSSNTEYVLKKAAQLLQSQNPTPSADDMHQLQLGLDACNVIINNEPENTIAQTVIDKIQKVLKVHTANKTIKPVDENTKKLMLHEAANNLDIPVSDFAPSTPKEHALQERIEIFEESFLQFGKYELLPKVALQTNKELEQSLSEPFNTVALNRANPLRNQHIAERISSKSRKPLMKLLLARAEKDQFAYGPIPQHHTNAVAAGFSPTHWLMALGENMEGNTVEDMLIALHECIHIGQLKELMQKNLQLYANVFVNQKPRVLVPLEYQAYGLQLEALNIVMNNKVRQHAARGQAIPRQDLIDCLKTKKPESDMVTFLQMLGQYYFPNGNAVHEDYSDTYKGILIHTQLHDGFETFDIQNGKLVQVQRK